MRNSDDGLIDKVKRTINQVEALDIRPEYKPFVFQVLLERHSEVPIVPTLERKSGPKIQSSGGVLTRRIQELISEDFFKEPRLASDVKIALKQKGHLHTDDSVRMALLRLVRQKILRRVSETREGKSIYLYTNP